MLLATDNISRCKHNFTCPTHFVSALQGILTGKHPAMSPGPSPLNPGPKTPLGPSSTTTVLRWIYRGIHKTLGTPAHQNTRSQRCPPVPQNPRDPQRTKTPYQRHRSAKQPGTAQHSLKRCTTASCLLRFRAAHVVTYFMQPPAAAPPAKAACCCNEASSIEAPCTNIQDRT